MLFADEAVSPEAIGVVFGALFAGAICGIWPLSAGANKGMPGLGVVGFVACVGSGFVFGCLLALPTALFFRLLIGALNKPLPPDGLGGAPFNPYANGKRADHW